MLNVMRCLAGVVWGGDIASLKYIIYAVHKLIIMEEYLIVDH